MKFVALIIAIAILIAVVILVSEVLRVVSNIKRIRAAALKRSEVEEVHHDTDS